MDVESAVKQVEASSAFKAWQHELESIFLFGLFVMRPDQWEVIYYNTKNSATTSFAVTGNTVSLVGQDVALLQQEEMQPEPLDVKKVLMTYEEALAASREKIKEKAGKEQNSFIVLQTKNHQPCWIVVIMTSDLKLERYIFHAETKQLLEEKTQDLSKSFRVEKKA